VTLSRRKEKELKLSIDIQKRWLVQTTNCSRQTTNTI